MSSVVSLKTDTCCGSHKGSPWSVGWSDFPPGGSERFLWPKPVMVHSRLMAKEYKAALIVFGSVGEDFKAWLLSASITEPVFEEKDFNPSPLKNTN